MMATMAGDRGQYATERDSADPERPYWNLENAHWPKKSSPGSQVVFQSFLDFYSPWVKNITGG